ncbi:MAG: 2-oxoglutarate dehydrogenase complex dihydrolipoyllysine-residue succinyltransferase [Rudaea sp.]
MALEIKVPVLPESVSDATIASWHKKAGDAVKRDENLVDLETDKVVLEVPSPVDGVLKEIKQQTGTTVTSQQVLAIIEEGAAPAASGPPPAKTETPKAAATVSTAASPSPSPSPSPESGVPSPAANDLSPAAQRVASENRINPAQVSGTGRGGQVTKEDLVNFMRSGGTLAKAPAPATQAPTASSPAPAAPGPATPGSRPEERVPMTRMRAKIAERLMQSKNSIAMLTSFNEVNLGKIVAMRKELGEQFEKANGIKLGYMSFFVRAACEALKRHPVVNASVDGNDVIYHGYQDISVAVSTDRGLVTPVLRDAQSMDFAEIETAIANYAKAAREGGLKIEDLQGGTFTITNGGTFGSLFSTPIVNPPQSAILGMHTIKERAMVENGQVVAAPMMYIAISYDHRVVDGKDAVLFLVDIKNQLENPHKMLLGL